MARVKGGVTTRRRHKKIRSLATGYRLGRKKLFRLANQAQLKAGQFAFRDRRVKKRQFRRLWIIRLNAAARQHGLTYGQLINGLRLANIGLNRKVLSIMARQFPESFERIVDRVKRVLNIA